MLYKQIKLFKLTEAFNLTKEKIQEKLEFFTFRDCPPSHLQSLGWVPPINDENAPLLQMLNGYLTLCLQIEEKILPAIVIRQELIKKVRMIEKKEDRKVYQKEKNTIKDELIMTLLPRAFTKISQIYAYIDVKNAMLVLSTTNEKRGEQFLSLFKKSFGDIIEAFEMENLSHTLTHWLQHQSYPTEFAIEKSCVLQDQNQTNRVIRAQHQDLFASSIQTLIKDGCQVKQIALEWQDQVSFHLLNDFSFSAIKFKDEIIAATKDLELETIEQKFTADFFLLTETITKLVQALVNALSKGNVVAMASGGNTP